MRRRDRVERSAGGTKPVDRVDSAPDGKHFHVPAGSLGEAREECERLRTEFGAGVYRLPETVPA